MLTISKIEDLRSEKLALTVGIFDGVHKGHLFLLHSLVKEAQSIRGKSVVFSLHPHPRKVLQPAKTKPSMLTSEDEKTRLLEKAGVDYLIQYPFNLEFAKTSGSDFIKNLLHKKLGISSLLVGYDHSFGCDRLTPSSGLRHICNSLKIKLIESTPWVDKEGQQVSSSRIREALKEGNPEKANSMLGYAYSIKGKVIHGNHLGRTLNFPTANISPEDPDKLIPKDGVYAATVQLQGKSYSGMLNIGLRPTINAGNSQTIEVHLFDFEGDIYGETLNIAFKKYMRPEKHFRSLDDLRTQMEKDKKEVLQALRPPGLA